MATEDTAVSLKLHIVVYKKKNSVVFAESGKDFVDFIFHILSLPLGAVARILSETSNLGSLGTLQEGLKNLDPKSFQVSPGKQYILDFSKALYRGRKISQLLPEASFSKPHKLYRCSNGYSTYFQKPCGGSGCCYETSIQPQNAGALLKGSEGGYVKEDSTFMVLDDLTVRSSVATAGISILDEFSIKDFGAIEKKEVSFSTNEAIKLLKASMSSKTVLTDVFLTGGAAVKVEN